MDYQNYFRNKKITVMGLGLLGRGIGDVKFLAEGGADLLVTDLKSEKELAPSLKKLRSSKKLKAISYHLGGHRLEDFRNRDLILKAAGVPLDSLFIAEAEKNKIPVAMSTALFAKFAAANGAKIIGVTGTRGKSTVTQMIYEIIKEHLGLNRSQGTVGRTTQRAVLGGNVKGVSTLALLKKIKKDDWAVLELDSWQLQGFGYEKISPQIAVFTNLLPDHLNYYGGSMEKYAADKANIFKFQKSGDYLVRRGELPADWRLKIPGKHNRQNAALVKKVAEILKIKPALIKKVITNFGGVAGRLELVRTWRGIKIYNDTTSTTPVALAAALKALGPASLKLRRMKSITLIAGGADKNLDFTEVFPLLKKYCKEIILLPGTGTEKLGAWSLECGAFKAKTLKEAVTEARKLSRDGDIILFSPGFASFGLFKNEFDRGAQFDKLIKMW